MNNIKKNSELIFFIFLYIMCALIVLFLRQRSGYLTPDEVNFYHNNYVARSSGVNFNLFETSESLDFKYYITSFLFQKLLGYGSSFVYYFNITIVAIAFYFSYKTFVLRLKIIERKLFCSMFFLPSVLFFSVSILRDIIVFALIILILTLFAGSNKINLSLLFMVFLVFLLRPEMGFILFSSFLFLFIKTKKYRKIAIICFVVAGFSLMAYLTLYTSYYDDKIYRAFFRDNLIGILGFSPDEIFLPKIFISNILFFYSPLFDDFFIKSRLGNLMALSSAFYVYLWIEILFKIKFRIFSKNNVMNCCAINLILFLPVMANETDALAAARHVVYVLPFLFLYYGIGKNTYKVGKKVKGIHFYE